MILHLLACALPDPPSSTVAITSAWAAPTDTGGVTVNVVAAGNRDWPVTSVLVEGLPATLTRSGDDAHVTATLVVTAETLAMLEANDDTDGVIDGVGILTVVARTDVDGVEATTDVTFAVDPTPRSAVDRLSVEVHPESDVWGGLAAPYLPADGTVLVWVEVVADLWAEGDTATAVSTGATPTPASGELVRDGDDTYFAFTTRQSGTVAAGQAGVLVVGATAGERADYASVPVAGAPLLSGATALTAATAGVTASYRVSTAGSLKECRADLYPATAAVIAELSVDGWSALLGGGWVAIADESAEADISVSVGALGAATQLVLTCRDPYAQTGSLTVAISPVPPG